MKILIALAALLLASCTATAPTETPQWRAEYDGPWVEVVACWKAHGYDPSRVKRPVVIVREDCRSKWSAQDFYSAECGGWVFGQAFVERSRVEVCPDLKALRHEMSHVALWQLTGDSGEHVAGGCFDVL